MADQHARLDRHADKLDSIAVSVAEQAATSESILRVMKEIQEDMRDHRKRIASLERFRSRVYAVTATLGAIAGAAGHFAKEWAQQHIPMV